MQFILEKLNFFQYWFGDNTKYYYAIYNALTEIIIPLVLFIIRRHNSFSYSIDALSKVNNHCWYYHDMEINYYSYLL